MQELWKKTNDKKGIEPTFEMRCPFCGNKMILRNSSMSDETKGATGHDNTVLLIIQRYKCIRCAFVANFDIWIPNEYWSKILTLRDNKTLYYPPIWEWENEDKEIEKQLKSMGYFD